MEFYLKAKQSNILNFEHTYLLTMETLKGILAN